MLQLLHSAVETRADELSREFNGASPFRHVVIESFLRSDFCDRLIHQFPAFEERKAINELGQVGRKAVHSNIALIGDAYRQFDELMKSRELLQLMGKITSIPGLLYDPEYAGGGTHENLNGQDLDLHVDFNYHPTRGYHRRLNLIVFLNPRWDAKWGGCLELHRNPWNPGERELKSISPDYNRAVIFETTETSWHGFTRITLPSDRQGTSRRSLAVYFYTRERPGSEAAPSHGTVYVPRPLPDHLRAGYTLTAEDEYTLQLLTARRDEQIRFLYERELEFSEAITAITQSASFRLGRLLTWPARKLRRRP